MTYTTLVFVRHRWPSFHRMGRFTSARRKCLCGSLSAWFGRMCRDGSRDGNVLMDDWNQLCCILTHKYPVHSINKVISSFEVVVVGKFTNMFNDGIRKNRTGAH